MRKSVAYPRALRGIVPLLLCAALVGCAPKRDAPTAKFTVVVAADGRTAAWFLRMTGPAFNAMVHESARKPQLGTVDSLTHQKIAALIAAGLLASGLAPCDPTPRTVAMLRGGTLQWTGVCPLPTDVNVANNGT